MKRRFGEYRRFGPDNLSPIVELLEFLFGMVGTFGLVSLDSRKGKQTLIDLQRENSVSLLHVKMVIGFTRK